MDFHQGRTYVLIFISCYLFVRKNSIVPDSVFKFKILMNFLKFTYVSQTRVYVVKLLKFYKSKNTHKYFKNSCHVYFI